MYITCVEIVRDADYPCTGGFFWKEHEVKEIILNLCDHYQEHHDFLQTLKPGRYKIYQPFSQAEYVNISLITKIEKE